LPSGSQAKLNSNSGRLRELGIVMGQNLLLHEQLPVAPNGGACSLRTCNNQLAKCGDDILLAQAVTQVYDKKRREASCRCNRCVASRWPTGRELRKICAEETIRASGLRARVMMSRRVVRREFIAVMGEIHRADWE